MLGVAAGVLAGVATGAAGVVTGENANGGVVAAGVALGVGTTVTAGVTDGATGAGAGAGVTVGVVEDGVRVGELGEGRAVGNRPGAGAGAKAGALHCEAVAGAVITATSHQPGHHARLYNITLWLFWHGNQSSVSHKKHRCYNQYTDTSAVDSKCIKYCKVGSHCCSLGGARLCLPYLDLSSELCMMCLHLCSAQQTAFRQQHYIPFDVQSQDKLVYIDCRRQMPKKGNIFPMKTAQGVPKLTAYIIHLQCYTLLHVYSLHFRQSSRP